MSRWLLAMALACSTRVLGGQPPGNAEMAALLKRCVDVAAARPGRYDNEERARWQLEREKAGKVKSAPALLAVAKDLLSAGRAPEAIERLTKARALAEQPGHGLPPGFLLDVRRTLIMAYLRFGELRNCVAMHGPDSCLFPIRGGGIHRDKSGSQMAIVELRSLLEDHPEDDTARWLLNVAHMTLGEFPEKVPAQWAIPTAMVASPCVVPRFPDVGSRLGITRKSHAGGCVMDDLDGDGDLDLMVSAKGLDEQLRFYRNDGDGTFSERSEEAGLKGITGGLNLIHADYDNDGRLDVLVLRAGRGRPGAHHPNSLLRNEADGTWRDVTRESGLLDVPPAAAGCFGDYDNDGRLDLFLGNEADCPEHPEPVLLRGRPDGTFARSGRLPWPAGKSYVRGAIWADIDNDGRLDLYVSRHGGTNLLFRNLGPGAGWAFQECGARAGVQEPIFSFPAWAFDYDNDGWLDLVCASHGPRVTAAEYAADPARTDQLMATLDDSALWTLTGMVARGFFGLPSQADSMRVYRNNGDGTFTSAEAGLGLTMPIQALAGNFGDLDDDGWPDFYLGTGGPSYSALTPNRLFKNIGGKRFLEATTHAGMGHLQKGHAVAFGDLDADGDLDVYAVMGGALAGDSAIAACYANPGFGNRWLELQLEGRESNRSALGSRIRVQVETPGGSRQVHATVSSGGSFGASPLRQHIGLGDAKGIAGVTVRWPSGRVQQLDKLEMGRRYRVREGDANHETIDLKRHDFTARP